MKYGPIEAADAKSCFSKEDSDIISTYSKSESLDPIKLENFKSTGYVTSGSNIFFSSYLRTFPYEMDILRNAVKGDPKTRDEKVAKFAEEFLSIFERVLLNNRNIIDNSTHLPPLRFIWLDDNSLLIEWIFKDFRIGFSIEPNLEESGWYLVSNQNLGEISISGFLNFSQLEQLIIKLLNFVLRYA